MKLCLSVPSIYWYIDEVNGILGLIFYVCTTELRSVCRWLFKNLKLREIVASLLAELLRWRGGQSEARAQQNQPVDGSHLSL